jgi:hypothetical protein
MFYPWYRGRVQPKANRARKGHRPGSGPAAGWKPAVEPLEERTLLSVFGPPTNYATPQGGPGDVAVGDINGDGIPDIVSANQNANSVSVLLGKGDGTFGPHKDYGAGSITVAVGLGDLNKDGRLDIVAVNDFGESASVLLNNGDGTFARTDYSPGIGLAVSLALGDLNGDGNLDIVVSDYTNSKAVVLLGKGDGTFTNKSPFSVPGTNTRQLALGDLNHDGKLDLVVTYQNSAVASVLLGNGNGTFGPGTNYGTGGNPTNGLTLGDVNGDGQLDIVTANSKDPHPVNSISVLLNHGDGTFGAKTDYTVGTKPDGVALGDLNGDGHTDIISANEVGGNVSVLLGNGDGTFGPKTDFAVGTSVTKVALGDLNGDGKLDAVTTNGGAAAVSVLLNTSGTTLPSLSIADGSVKENPHGTTYLSLPVTLSAASAQTVTVHYDTSPGTATPGIDYVGRHGTLTFLPGQTTRNVRVHILNDQPTGANEQFFVSLSNAVNATIADGQAVATIIETSGGVPVPGSSPGAATSGHSRGATSVLANDPGILWAGCFASLSARGGQAVAVQPGPGGAGSRSSPVTLQPGQITRIIHAKGKGDTPAQADAMSLVTLVHAAHATLGDGPGLGTLPDLS